MSWFLYSDNFMVKKDIEKKKETWQVSTEDI